MLSIEVIHQKKNIVIISSIYRSPVSDGKQFKKMYENLIKKGLSSFYAICLIGDMNINSLDYEAHNVQKNS